MTRDNIVTFILQIRKLSLAQWFSQCDAESRRGTIALSLTLALVFSPLNRGVF